MTERGSTAEEEEHRKNFKRQTISAVFLRRVFI